MKVFVIILNWNQPELTIECIKSVLKMHHKNFELNIVIVDNGSSDDSIKKFETLNNIEILKNSVNMGFAEGNNVGIRHALNKNAEFVMLLNNDTEVDENLAEELLKVAVNNEEVGIVSPKIYFARGFEFHGDRYEKADLGKVIWYAGGVIDWDNVYGSNRGVDEVDKGQYDDKKELDFATGACMLLRSSALKEAGVFDKKYFLYLEDLDLSYRMKESGWKIVFAPKARLWHKVSQSSGIGSNLNDYFITRNRLLFGMRYAKLRTKIALLRESIKFLLIGRSWQKRGVWDFYFGNLGKGNYK